MEHNFESYTTASVDTQNTPYDYGSVMHYSAYAFSSNNLPTIVPLQSNVVLGQRDSLSAIDIQEVRLYYNCTGSEVTLPTVPTTSMNPPMKIDFSNRL